MEFLRKGINLESFNICKKFCVDLFDLFYIRFFPLTAFTKDKIKKEKALQEQKYKSIMYKCCKELELGYRLALGKKCITSEEYKKETPGPTPKSWYVESKLSKEEVNEIGKRLSRARDLEEVEDGVFKKKP